MIVMCNSPDDRDPFNRPTEHHTDFYLEVDPDFCIIRIQEFICKKINTILEKNELRLTLCIALFSTALHCTGFANVWQDILYK